MLAFAHSRTHVDRPYLPNPPGAGDSVTVILGCLPGDPASGLSLRVNGSPVKGVTWSLTSVSPITYTAKLSTKLTPLASVKVLQNYPPQRDPDCPSQTDTGPPSAPAAVFAVSEGATTVTGSAPGADKVRVQLVDGGKVLAVAPDATVDATTNQFTATFTAPLQADQRLWAFGVSKTGSLSDTATATEVNPYGIDWGRVRGFFTAGVILSNNNSQFNLTNANSFVDFNIDKAWLRPRKSFDSLDHSFLERFRLHSFFDARLTAIPVGTSGSTGRGGMQNQLVSGLYYLPRTSRFAPFAVGLLLAFLAAQILMQLRILQVSGSFHQPQRESHQAVPLDLPDPADAPRPVLTEEANPIAVQRSRIGIAKLRRDGADPDIDDRRRYDRTAVVGMAVLKMHASAEVGRLQHRAAPVAAADPDQRRLGTEFGMAGD